MDDTICIFLKIEDGVLVVRTTGMDNESRERDLFESYLQLRELRDALGLLDTK